LGWWAWFQSWNPDQTLGDSREHRRFTQSLAWHVVAREKDISRHVGDGT